MPDSAYYDSCIFLNAQNTTHREHLSCLAITTPSKIRWVVWICHELIAAETTAIELVNAFEISCALEGVLVAHSRLDEAKSLASKRKQEKRRLMNLQLKNRDFMHLMCAVTSKAETLTSVDLDFWDAANKRNSNARRLLDGTKRAIEQCFPVAVMLPSELIDA